MQPWVKFGVAVYPVCLAILPAAFIILLLPITYLTGRITKAKWYKRLEALVLKPE